MKVQHIEDVLVEHGDRCVRDGRQRPNEYGINADDFDDLVARQRLPLHLVFENWSVPGGTVEVREVRVAMLPTVHGTLEVSRCGDVQAGSFIYSVALGVNANDDDVAAEAFERGGMQVGDDR